MPSHRRKPHAWEDRQEEEGPWGAEAVVAYVVRVRVADHVVLVVVTKVVAAVVALVPVMHA